MPGTRGEQSGARDASSTRSGVNSESSCVRSSRHSRAESEVPLRPRQSDSHRVPVLHGLVSYLIYIDKCTTSSYFSK